MGKISLATQVINAIERDNELISIKKNIKTQNVKFIKLKAYHCKDRKTIFYCSSEARGLKRVKEFEETLNNYKDAKTNNNKRGYALDNE